MPRPLKTKSAIAKDQGVTRQTVHTWMTDPRWTLGQAFPIDGEKIDVWRAETFSSSPTLAPPSAAFPVDDNYSTTRRRVDLQYRAEQTLVLRQKRALLEQKYIERELHDRAMVGLVGEFRRRVEEWLESLPPIFANQSETKIRMLLSDAYDRLCEGMMHLPELPLGDEGDVQQLKNEAKVNAARHMHYAQPG